VTVLSTVRQAFLSAELDERQLVPLLLDAGPCSALAALGTVIGSVVRVIHRDRTLLRGWLTEAEGAGA
jgi:hypothetical protein